MSKGRDAITNTKAGKPCEIKLTLVSYLRKQGCQQFQPQSETMPLLEGTGSAGPQSVALIAELDPVFDARATRLVIDYDRSHDN